MSRKFVITGGAGFIGSHLAEALVKEKKMMFWSLTTCLPGKLENLAGLDVKFLKGSITNIELLKQSFQGADCVFHLAAIASVNKCIDDPLRTNEVGTDGTLKVLLAARDADVRRVVLASSAAIYGSSEKLPKREDLMPEPISPYAIPKLASEYYAGVSGAVRPADSISTLHQRLRSQARPFLTAFAWEGIILKDPELGFDYIMTLFW